MSESLLVEKVTGTSGREVIVTYVARDEANNVGKASRAFEVKDSYGGRGAEPAEEDTFGSEGVTGTETAAENETESKEEDSSAEVEEGQEESQAEGDNGDEPIGPNPILVLNADVIEKKKGTAPNWN